MKIIGIILLIYTAILSINTSLNFGNIAIFSIGLLMILFSITKNQIVRKMRTVFLIGITAMLALICFFAGFGVHDTATYSENAVIVLGAGLRGSRVSKVLADRLDTAITYSEKNPLCKIVVSGGQGFEEDITEAQAMEDYLISHGIDKSRIIREEQATSTYENFLYSKQLCSEYFGTNNYTACYITNDFHIYRASKLAKNAGLSTTWAHTPTQWYLTPVCYVRECAAILKLWVLGR